MLDEACREAEKEPERQGKSEGKWKAHDKTIEKLFGSREYRFRLRLKNKFPTTIYKERNLAIAVELVDVARNCVMNGKTLLIQPTLFTSELLPATQTESGSPRPSQEPPSCRVRPRLTSITARLPSTSSLLVMWVGPCLGVACIS